MSEIARAVLLHPLSCAANRHVISGGVTDESFCDCGLTEMRRAVTELATLRRLVGNFASSWPYLLRGQHAPFCTALYGSRGQPRALFEHDCDCLDAASALVRYRAAPGETGAA
jgi:hypothetical protein